MAKRFGRNQRRQLMAALSKAQEETRAANMKVRSLRYDLECAVDDAFQRFMKHDKRMHMYLDKIAASLGQALGRELMPHAQKLMAATREQPSIEAIINTRTEAPIIVLEGKIPSFHYRVHTIGALDE